MAGKSPGGSLEWKWGSSIPWWHSWPSLPSPPAQPAMEKGNFSQNFRVKSLLEDGKLCRNRFKLSFYPCRSAQQSQRFISVLVCVASPISKCFSNTWDTHCSFSNKCLNTKCAFVFPLHIMQFLEIHREMTSNEPPSYFKWNSCLSNQLELSCVW